MPKIIGAHSIVYSTNAEADRAFLREVVGFRTGVRDAHHLVPWTGAWPAGHGVLTETITLSDDGQTYASTIKLVTYDRADRPGAGGGEGTGAGRRIVF